MVYACQLAPGVKASHPCWQQWLLKHIPPHLLAGLYKQGLLYSTKMDVLKQGLHDMKRAGFEPIQCLPSHVVHLLLYQDVLGGGGGGGGSKGPIASCCSYSWVQYCEEAGTEEAVGVQAIAVAACYREDWPLLVITPSIMRLTWGEALPAWLPSHIQPNIISIGKGEVGLCHCNQTPTTSVRG